MRTLHVGLRVADLERSIAFYTTLGYEVLGEVPVTELGRLTMLKLPDDEFVSPELVHDPTPLDSILVGSATSSSTWRPPTKRSSASRTREL